MTTYSLPALRYGLDALEPLVSADTLERVQRAEIGLR